MSVSPRIDVITFYGHIGDLGLEGVLEDESINFG